MKTLIIFFLLLSAKAMACPNLNGTYQCKGGVIAQMNLDKFDDTTIFSISKEITWGLPESIFVDNQLHSFNYTTSDGICEYCDKEKYTSSCQDDGVIVRYSFDFLNYSKRYIHYKINGFFNVKKADSGNVFVQIHEKWNDVLFDKEDETTGDSFLCRKI